MSSELKKTSCWVCCLCLLLAGLAGAAVAEEGASILSRIQVVDDPELGELIRIALANLPESKRVAKFYHRRNREKEKYNQLLEQEEIAKLRTVRSVTEAYAQITLLDTHGPKH